MITAKRLFDVLSAGVALIILLPLLGIVALGVRLSSQGAIIYRAKRVGRLGQPFTLYKFRSMYIDADQRGPGITGAGDQRVTPFGRFLRKTKLDELPQLWNVIRGEMSIVGPRPEAPQYVAYYTSEQRQVLSVRPGITSWSSVAYRYEEKLLNAADWERQYIEMLMPAKLALDLAYVDQANWWVDLKIIFKTILALF